MEFEFTEEGYKEYIGAEEYERIADSRMDLLRRDEYQCYLDYCKKTYGGKNVSTD